MKVEATSITRTTNDTPSQGVMGTIKGLIAGPIKGYKAFNPDFTCLGFQFEVGQSYELPDGLSPILCERGFHFCQIPIHCNTYYDKNRNPRYAEIEAWDVIHGIDGKSVARKIRIVREIPKDKWDKLEGRFEGYIGAYYLSNGRLHREDGPAIERVDGNKEWYHNGQRHREDGPAIETVNGHREWYRSGLLHREDGPAIERGNGTKEWYKNGKLHREDGPAQQMVNGTKIWYKNGQCHREDGPAFEQDDGTRIWYKNGRCYRRDVPSYLWDQLMV